MHTLTAYLRILYISLLLAYSTSVKAGLLEEFEAVKMTMMSERKIVAEEGVKQKLMAGLAITGGVLLSLTIIGLALGVPLFYDAEAKLANSRAEDQSLESMRTVVDSIEQSIEFLKNVETAFSQLIVTKKIDWLSLKNNTNSEFRNRLNGLINQYYLSSERVVVALHTVNQGMKNFISLKHKWLYLSTKNLFGEELDNVPTVVKLYDSVDLYEILMKVLAEEMYRNPSLTQGYEVYL